MSASRPSFRFKIAFAVVLVTAAISLAFTLRRGCDADLHSLVDPDRRTPLAVLAEASSSRVNYLFSAPTAAAAAEAANAWRGKRAPAQEFKDLLAALAPHARGLLSDAARERLLRGEFAAVARDSAARLFGFGAPLLPVKDDPFLLASDWLESLGSLGGTGWSLKDGVPVKTAEGRGWALVSEPVPADIIAAYDRATARDRELAAHGSRLHVGGAPFHVALATERSKREINLLSLVSLVVVVVLGWWLFRSWRFVPHLALAVAFSFLVATAATFAVFARPHLLVFVFGTSLVGLSVDYVYHVRAARGFAPVARPLFSAFLTTAASFLPLLFSSVSVLRQMAVFTVSGLATTLAFVAAFGAPAAEAPPVEAPPAGERALRWGRPLVWLLAALALAGVWRLRSGCDPSSFYRAESRLAEGEKMLVRLSGANTRFAVVSGKDLQQALAREEAAGVKGLSALVPSIRRQRENARLVDDLIAAEGKRHMAMTGIPVDGLAAWRPLALEQDAPGPLRDLAARFIVHAAEGVRLVSPLAADAPDPHGEGVRVVSPKAELNAAFDAYSRQTMRLLGVSFAVLAFVLALLLRRRTLSCLAPVALAAACTLGVLGWCGARLDFFHALCFFVFVGLGVDYAIFERTAPSPATRRTVFASFLTSFCSLGMLAFTEFAVTRAMGGTLACALAFAYLFARAFAPRREGNAADAVHWANQSEQSAGPLRLWVMWQIYALLGKNCLKVATVTVMLFIYPFARPARRALRDFYAVLGLRAGHARLFRHLLGFALGLVDKTDACTLKRDPPAMRTRDDEGWRSFRDAVDRGDGAFLLCTHLGTIEILPALAANASSRAGSVKMHAFQQMGHDAAFMRVFMRHFDSSHLTLQAVEAIGPETAVEMQEAIARGELVMMAGDRLSAANPGAALEQAFLGRKCRWPKGAFAFAHLLEAPIWFVTVVRTGWNAHEAHFRRFPGGTRAELLRAYVAFLEEETRARPDQWYNFYPFFGNQVSKTESSESGQTTSHKGNPV